MGAKLSMEQQSLPSASSSTTSLRVVTYNTFLRPHIVQNDAQVERSVRIPSMLQQFGADVVCLQECWSKFGSRNVIRGLKAQGFFYVAKTRRVKKFCVLHAGLLTCSKYPIVTSEFVPFDVCSGTDCLATKGFLYTQLVHPVLRAVHVFNLHLQFVTSKRLSSTDFKKLEVQKQQLQKWQAFMKARSIPLDEVVVVAGDWNFDRVNNAQLFEEMVGGLQLQLPVLVGEQTVSVDPTQNMLVGRGNEARLYGCVDMLYTGNKCTCCPNRWVDFVMYSQSHRQPVASQCTIVPVTTSPFPTFWTAQCNQLSDHYPVVCTLDF